MVWRVQNPVYMVFACLVADQDLLFVLYDVPCISICRAEQRAKALERLGMPNTVYKEIEERGGGHVVAPVPARNTTVNDDGTPGGDSSAGQDMGGIWAAIARQTSQAKGAHRRPRSSYLNAYRLCACASSGWYMSATTAGLCTLACQRQQQQ